MITPIVDLLFGLEGRIQPLHLFTIIPKPAYVKNGLDILLVFFRITVAAKNMPLQYTFGGGKLVTNNETVKYH